MGILTVVFSLFGKTLGWLVRPPVVYFVVALVCAGLGWHWHADKVAAAHAAAYQAGYAKGQSDGYAAGYGKGEKDEAQAYETKLAAERARAFTIVANERVQQESIVADLTTRLTAAQKAATVIRHAATIEVTRYVTPKADAAATVPAGFVYLYNLSLSTDPISFSASQPADADAPSGVALSTIASIASVNNAECVQRGEVIEAWQTWYARNKALFDHTIAQQAAP